MTGALVERTWAKSESLTGVVVKAETEGAAQDLLQCSTRRH